jgi:hypothetical protein
VKVIGVLRFACGSFVDRSVGKERFARVRSVWLFLRSNPLPEMAYAGFRDYEEFFDEQEKRWNMPSEPIEDWLARIQLHKHSSTIIADAPIHDAK